MRCPNCGASRLSVKVVLAGTAVLRFDGDVTVVATDDFESEVPDVSTCECGECGWVGMACDARPGDESSSGGPLCDDELRHLMSTLQTSPLPEITRAQLEAALTELILLRRISEIQGSADSADTVIM